MRRRFLSAQWRHLLMLNYEIDPALLLPLVPHGTELDAWRGRTFASMVGFLFLDTRVLGIPIPFHRNFEEINLRFYVRRRTADGWRRGVVFVKELVPRWAIAFVARWLYNENYQSCPMRSRIELPDADRGVPGSVEYGWTLGRTTNALRAVISGPPELPTSGSEEEFITEHYWGYTVQRDGSAMEYEVAHPPWRVWRAGEARLDCDVEVCYGRDFCAALGREASSAFVAEGSAISVYRGARVPTDVAAPPEVTTRPPG